MSSDLRDLLQASAREPTRPPDPDDIHRRGRRKRQRLRVATMAIAVITVAGAAVSAAQLLGDNERTIVVDQPEPSSPPDGPSDVEPSEHGSADGTPTVGVHDLSAVVAVAEDRSGGTGEGRIRMFSPDGREAEIRLDTATPSAKTWFPDDRGGVVWQLPPGVSGSGPLLHVSPEGETTTLLPGTVGGEKYRLVGTGDGGRLALVEHTPEEDPNARSDLLAVPHDGDGRDVVVPDIGGWEDLVTESASSDGVFLFANMATTSESATVHRPGREPTVVFTGGESSGEYVHGVAIAAAPLRGVVLVHEAAGFPEYPTARLILVDIEAGISEEVDVPLQLAIGDTWAVARDVSMHGDHLLVNRDAEGTWLRPLVMSLSTREWAVLDVRGRAQLTTATELARDASG